jgi:DNA-binding transcriptional LysR family regulator
MRIEQIKNFIKTVDTLNITKAAEGLYITQSVLSKQIAGMEHELGAKLFDRGRAGIRLTPVGVVAYEGFVKALQSYENAVHNIEEYQSNVKGALWLAKLSGLKQPESLLKAITDFGARYPNVDFLRKSLNNKPMCDSIQGGGHDLYLTWRQDVDGSPHIEYIPLKSYKVSLAISASHPLASVDAPEIGIFRDVAWITIHEEESYRFNCMIADVVNGAGFKPQMIHAENLSDMIDLIHDGIGVGLVCEGHILHGAATMEFKDFPEIPSWTMVVASRRDNKNPMRPEFLSILRKYALV